MTAQIWITFLYGLSGILPLIGLYRLARSTGKWKRAAEQLVQERGHDYLTHEDLDPSPLKLTDLPREAMRQVTWDVALVGGGVFLAAIASIWSVWV